MKNYFTIRKKNNIGRNYCGKLYLKCVKIAELIYEFDILPSLLFGLAYFTLRIIILFSQLTKQKVNKPLIFRL